MRLAKSSKSGFDGEGRRAMKREKADIGRAIGAVWLLTVHAVCFLCALGGAGCVSKYTGSRTVVGEQMAFPELTDSSDSVSLRVFESIKGARIWTAKDSRVRVEYANTYTNLYFGVVETRDAMRLTVDIEPKAAGSAAEEGGAKKAEEE